MLSSSTLFTTVHSNTEFPEQTTSTLATIAKQRLVKSTRKWKENIASKQFSTPPVSNFRTSTSGIGFSTFVFEALHAEGEGQREAGGLVWDKNQERKGRWTIVNQTSAESLKNV